MGVQTDAPRLSWIATARDATLRGLNVTGYRVIVSSSPANLTRNEGDLWDTRKVNAKNTLQSRYAGKPLRAGKSYWWKVQIWDQHEAAGRWSDVATFTMGMQPSDWTAQWITADPQVLGTDPQKDATAVPVFRHAFRTNGTVKRAILFVSGLGQYEALVNGQPVTDSVLNPGWTDYRKTILYNAFDVTRELKVGGNVIAVLMGNGMYNVPHTPQRYRKLQGTFGPPKLIAQLILTHADGSEETVGTDDSWTTSKSPITFSSTYGGEDYDARCRRGGSSQSSTMQSGLRQSATNPFDQGNADLQGCESDHTKARRDRLRPWPELLRLA